MHHALFWFAEAFYVLGFILSLFFLRSRVGSPYPATVALVVAGFALHTVGLLLRGLEIQACPISNYFESLMFINWAIVLIYLIVGAIFRVSFLGAFVIPLVVGIGAVALLIAPDQTRNLGAFKSPWLGLHASLSLVAYGAFALAFITGLMYLLQERQLKARRLLPWFHRLPSIDQLDRINFRLLAWGLVLLTLGLVFGFVLGAVFLKDDLPKTVWSVLIWLGYSVVLALRMTGRLRGRKIALSSVVAFVLVMLTFPAINLISRQH